VALQDTKYEQQDSGISNTNYRWINFNLISIANERDPSTLYDFFGYVAHAINYSKVDPIGRNSTSEKLTLEGIHLRCADLGYATIQG
jgi:hypothetical protein